MATFASQLRGAATAPCNQILNVGSLVLCQNLATCTPEPVVHTLTVDTATAVDDETISLTSDQAETYLRAGSILHFGTDTVQVATATTVTSAATPVPTEPITAVIAASTTATTWAMLRILSPTAIPLPLENDTVDVTNLNSIQTEMTKVGLNYNPEIGMIASLDDIALWDVFFEGTKSTKDIFVNIVYSSTQLGFGRCLAMNYNNAGENKEVIRPTVALQFQGEDYDITSPWSRLETAKQDLVNDVLKLSGLNVYS